MQLWQQILTFISASATTTIVLAYLVRLLLKSGLDKDLERYKSELKSGLDKELEKYKSELEAQLFQFQKRFSLIHEKRAEVLEGLYAHLDRTARALADLTSPFQSNDEGALSDKKAATWAINKEFSDYYSTKKIYLDENLCNQIENIQKILYEAWSAFDTSQDGEHYKPDPTGLWRQASKMVTENIPPLKKQLEERFRKELGSINWQ